MIEKNSFRRMPLIVAAAAFAASALYSAAPAHAHGDVAPQPVDTKGLKALPDGDWLSSNPYRGNKKAIEIGSSAYNQNCARCHGLDAQSGGIAPDLRELGTNYDDYFIGRVRKGVHRNGVTYMPAFQDTLNQEAMWAILSYLDKRHYELEGKDLETLYSEDDSKQ
ncbi:cytochrome c-550 PedF [Salinisphaera orenii]|nr:cytochrome c-550 PedF [Salinisphaera halophila]